MADWEDYLMAAGVTAGGVATYLQNDPKYFVLLTGLSLFAKALKDIRDSRKSKT